MINLFLLSSLYYRPVREVAEWPPKGGQRPLYGRSFRVEAAVGDLEPLRDASFRERGRRARAEPAFWARERCERCEHTRRAA